MDTQAVVITRRSGRKVHQETVWIPSDHDLIEAALVLRQSGGDTNLAAGQYGSCLGVYNPPRKYDVQDIDPFTGKRGKLKKGGGISATCSFWLGRDIRVAEAMYEREPLSIHYYCKRASEIQLELWDAAGCREITEGLTRIVEQTEYERTGIFD